MIQITEAAARAMESDREAVPVQSSVELTVYVERGCLGCQRALAIAETMSGQFANLLVEVVDLADTETDLPDSVTATPTFLLNGDLYSMGNPSLSDLRADVRRLLGEQA